MMRWFILVADGIAAAAIVFFAGVFCKVAHQAHQAGNTPLACVAATGAAIMAYAGLRLLFLNGQRNQ